MLSSSLQFGSTRIEYDVSFTRRKTIAIEVHPDQRVSIIAPDGSEPATIEALLYKRASWILRQQQQFSTYAPQEILRAYVSGESYRYLGRQYRLKVLEGQPEGVKYERNFIYVTVSDKNNTKHIQSVLEQWYRDEARHVFYERLKMCYPRVERLEIPYPSLSISIYADTLGKLQQLRINYTQPQARTDPQRLH